MKEQLKNLINKFKEYKVLVIGDAILDTYIKGNTDRLCREAPVPIIDVETHEHDCGGAANAAINVAALGAETWFLSALGKDESGKALLDVLRKAGVNTEYIVRDRKRKTLAKKRVTASSSIVLRIDEGNTDTVTALIEEELIKNLKRLYKSVDAVVISDYSYGIITDSMIRTLKELRVKNPKPLVIDSKELHRFKDLAPTAVKPNYEEAIRLLNLPRLHGNERVIQIMEQGRKLMEITGASNVAATIDADGILLFEKRKKPYRIFSTPQDHRNAIGAGDTFISALALAFCAGASPSEAADIAAGAAAIVIRKEGTVTCSSENLKESLGESAKFLIDARILNEKLEMLRKEGKRIIFTNGCFDILHAGHINLLHEARKLGDILVVALNSDESIRKIKGDDRPVNSLSDRITVLTALDSVNYLISFDDDNSTGLVKMLRPDVFVKGGNYTIQTIQEAEAVKAYGGEVRIIPISIKTSTSAVIRKIRSSISGRLKTTKQKYYAKASGME
ncbi:MAG: D-glycero-beta-D-manno-heptose 1-phosphate adenylyltransferase [Cytophagaceae bacterium]